MWLQSDFHSGMPQRRGKVLVGKRSFNGGHQFGEQFDAESEHVISAVRNVACCVFPLLMNNLGKLDEIWILKQE